MRKNIWTICGLCAGLAMGMPMAASAESLIENSEVLGFLSGVDADDEVIDRFSSAVIVRSEDDNLVFGNPSVVGDDVKKYLLVTSGEDLYEAEYVNTADDWNVALFQLDQDEIDRSSDSKIMEMGDAHIRETATLYYLDMDYSEKTAEILITGSEADSDDFQFLQYDIVGDISEEFRAPAALMNQAGECIGVMVPGKEIGNDILAFNVLEGSAEQNSWTNSKGDVFTGDIVDPEKGIVADGKCIVEYASGERYEGEYVDGTKCGQGIYTWADGDRYEGGFSDGKMNGWGTYYWADGDVYEGEWVDEVREGFGRYTTASGTVYEGQWKNGKRAVYGIWTSENGMKAGQFGLEYQEDLGLTEAYGPDGRAWQVWIPKDQSRQRIEVYQVKNKDGSLVEDGLYFKLAADGTYSCSWYENGAEISSNLSSESYESGNVYTGRFTGDDTIEGTLVCQFAEDEEGNDYYIGSFADGQRNGIGIYLWADGTFHIGEYSDGDFEGAGLMYDPENEYWYNGTWHEDKKDGIGWRYSESTGLGRLTYEAGDKVGEEEF